MRIVLSTSRFLPYSWGGVETVAFGLAQVYQRLGHEVRIICAEPSLAIKGRIELKEDEYGGILVWRLCFSPAEQPAEAHWLHYNPALIPFLRQLLEAWRPDVFHALTFGLLSGAVIVAARELCRQVLYTATGYELICSLVELVKLDGSICDGRSSLKQCLLCRKPRDLKNSVLGLSTRGLSDCALLSLGCSLSTLRGREIWFFRLASYLYQRTQLMKEIVRKLDWIIAPSQWVRHILLQNGMDSSRVIVVHHGVQPEVFGNGVKLPSKHVRFAYIGRITPVKGVKLLIEAFKCLPPEIDATLAVYGPRDDHHRDYYELCHRLAHPDRRIQFCGPLDREQLCCAFKEIDCLVVPSIWHEVLGLVALEAFANRTPVVASDIGGLRDIVLHDKNGLLFRAGDRRALAQCLLRCCIEPGLLPRLSENIGTVPSVEDEGRILLDLYLGGNR